ncbi:hypothetical protein IMZ31_21805 (plasmid) [Pontibacillus sp. ALD_SL1]|uniref:hypothetical protein n=1 Tax=Pontibacillus sp. ALD_SL1 TaxID=2777185 RepID=UPI001A967F24|nr:hypothetical protein [Pontibacillus sp. ALD_SL1]QST02088.1 hypothetical protein IMZ31_21805 [Pontibacillus sp. ALD_SL1]
MLEKLRVRYRFYLKKRWSNLPLFQRGENKTEVVFKGAGTTIVLINAYMKWIDNVLVLYGEQQNRSLYFYEIDGKDLLYGKTHWQDGIGLTGDARIGFTDRVGTFICRTKKGECIEMRYEQG